ncbi:hypothetical protein FACS1894109_19640 [Spirochaetia bacterium]|nr:hypothetical protein FACS1894109_19640 [Spirochaetia bacterium]
MKRENVIGCRVSFPASFYNELEGFYQYENGSHQALKFEQFLSSLIGYGLEVYKRTLPWQKVDPAESAEGDGVEHIPPAARDAWDRGEVDADPCVLRYKR